MPVLAYTHGILITIVTLLSSLSSSVQQLSPSFLNTSSSNLSTSKTTLLKPTLTTTTLYPVKTTASNRSDSKMFSVMRRSRQTLDSSYQLMRDDITYTIPATNFAFTDHQSTYPGETSTITYPYITTSRPALHTVHHLHPYLTKLSAKPARRLPTQFTADASAPDSFEDDFVPLTPMYTSQIAGPRWSVVPSHHASHYTYPSKTNINYAHSASATAWSPSGLSLTGGTSSGWGGAHEPAAQHVIPITITEIHHKPRIDFKKLGIIALLKIGIAKLKAFGILKMLFFLLFKYKLVLLVLFTKFVLFMKAIKLLKALLIPFFLLALLPLLALLLPLLLIPLLLPLLLLLPVPVPALVRDKNGNARISVLSHLKVRNTDVIMDILSQLLDSEQCVERIACELATKKESKLFHPIVNWYLQKLGNATQNEKISSYVKAYTKTVKEYKGDHSEEDSQSWCAKKYACAKVSSGFFEDEQS